MYDTALLTPADAFELESGFLNAAMNASVNIGQVQRKKNKRPALHVCPGMPVLYVYYYLVPLLWVSLKYGPRFQN